MLCFLAVAQGLVASSRGHVGARPRAHAVRHRTTRCVEAGNDEVVARISDLFWENKRAQLDAEMDLSLRMLEEFAAREAALLLTVGALPEGAERLSLPASDAEAEAELLEAELEIARYEAEVSIQKTSAFWIGRLAEEKHAADAQIAELTAQASAAESRVAAAEARAAEAEAASKGVADTLPELRKLLDQLGGQAVAPASPPEAAAEEKKPAAKVEEKAPPEEEKPKAETPEAKAPVEKPKAEKPVAKAAEAKEEEKPPLKTPEKPKAKEEQEDEAPAAAAAAASGDGAIPATSMQLAPATNGAVIRVPDAKGATADMKSKYREAATKGEHVAQYLPSEEDTLDLLDAMSQLPEVPPPVEPGMNLRELRMKLAGLGLSTLGLRKELEVRWTNAMREQRTKNKSWDPRTSTWVDPI